MHKECRFAGEVSEVDAFTTAVNQISNLYFAAQHRRSRNYARRYCLLQQVRASTAFFHAKAKSADLHNPVPSSRNLKMVSSRLELAVQLAAAENADSFPPPSKFGGDFGRLLAETVAHTNAPHARLRHEQ
jgi:hypothetical protein